MKLFYTFYGLPLLLAVSSMLHFCSLSNGEPLAEGDNVCITSIPVKKDIAYEQPLRYEIKFQGMCGILPCTKTRTETRVDHKLKTVVEHITKVGCCPGYAETPSRQCAPICLQSCKNGKCVAPNTCKCSPEPSEISPGFVGPTCSRFTCLSASKWGNKCDRECNCTGNSYCSASTGKCLCYPGWQGANCTLECVGNECDSDTASNLLPPVIAEPEVNVIPSGSPGMSQKLQAFSQELRTTDGSEADEMISGRHMSDAGYTFSGKIFHCMIGFLAGLTIMLAIGFFVIKRQRDQARNQLYYAACGSSQGSNGSGSNYSGTQSSASSATYYSQANRSPAPLPINAEGAQRDKNLSFDAATREILRADDEQKAVTGAFSERNKFVLDPRVESHLIQSYRASGQNLYTDAVVVDTNSKSFSTPSPYAVDSEHSTSAVHLNPGGDHIYQVPKSPSQGTTALFFANSGNSESQAQATNHHLMPPIPEVAARDNDASDLYNSDNIYEEIKPRTPKRP